MDKVLRRTRKTYAPIGTSCHWWACRVRYLLGCVEESRNGRLDRALKHWIIAAKLGCDNSSEALTNASKAGVVSKENFDAVLGA
eukprot:scaffold2303_cov141-Skeletonema_menzelii.AAC.10